MLPEEEPSFIKSGVFLKYHKISAVGKLINGQLIIAGSPMVAVVTLFTVPIFAIPKRQNKMLVRKV